VNGRSLVNIKNNKYIKKYLTIKENNYYYRMIGFEESATDQSIIIRHLWHLHSKSTYHTNYGTMKPPYEYHLRGCSGRIIPESVSNRQKFITDYANQIQKIYFSELPKNSIIQKPFSHDVILDITNKGFSGYKIELFSYKRTDLLYSDKKPQA
jgi:hypothetical protein